MDKEKIQGLLNKEIPREHVLIDEPMSKHTSFKIGGNADIFVKVKSIKELKYVIKVAKKEEIHLTIIGNGSNILVKDNGIRGIVVKLELNYTNIEPALLNQSKIETILNTDIESPDFNLPQTRDIIITVGAGVKLGELAQRLLKEEITGFEFAAGIPGTIGGAVRMNAGAYGGEMKDIIMETKCLDLEQYEKNIEKINIDDIEITQEEATKSPEIIILNNKEQDFSYRHSIFMEKKYIILETKLELTKGRYEEIKEKMDENLSSRKEKQPINMPSAGSTFKRGKDYITAKLIDECGLKGYSVGDAVVSDLHAGFIVNKGKATAEDVIKLIKHIQNTVYEKTGKKIELEIEILGE